MINLKKVVEPPKAIQSGKNQVEMFDEPMNSESASFYEVVYEEKQTYVDWLEQQMNLDEFLFDEQTYDTAQVQEMVQKLLKI